MSSIKFEKKQNKQWHKKITSSLSDLPPHSLPLLSEAWAMEARKPLFTYRAILNQELSTNASRLDPEPASEKFWPRAASTRPIYLRTGHLSDELPNSKSINASIIEQTIRWSSHLCFSWRANKNNNLVEFFCAKPPISYQNPTKALQIL